MKTAFLLSFIAALISLNCFADDVTSPTPISPECEQAIVQTAKFRCDGDSKSNPAQASDCLFGGMSLKPVGDLSAEGVVWFSVNDGVAQYSYSIDMLDIGTCNFTIHLQH